MSNTENRNIVYIGSKSEELDAVLNYFQNKSSYYLSYNVIDFESLDDFNDVLLVQTPDCLIINFCETSEIDENILMQIMLFDSHSLLKSVPFVGIFKGQKQIKDQEILFGYGINFAFIKGNDIGQMFDNIFYISFEDESYLKKFAMARVNNLEAKIYTNGYITNFDLDNITLDCDIKAIDDKPLLNIDLYEGLDNPISFEINKYNNKGQVFNTIYSQTVEIPFADGWGEDEGKILEDAYTTWLQCKQDEFYSIKSVVYCYSRDGKVLSNLVKVLKDITNVNLIYRNVFCQKDKEIFRYSPGLILFDINGEEDFPKFNEMMIDLSNISSENRPIVLVFQNKSTSQALQNLFEYNLIISSNNKLKDENQKNLFKLVNNEKLKKQILFKSFPLNSNKNIAQFQLDVQITSITENDITFRAKEEIPFYCVMKITEPIEMFLLVVPPFKNLSQKLDSNHYMAIIMGLDSVNSNYLRKFVNQSIDSPLVKWGKIDFSKVQSKTENKEQVITPESLDTKAEEAENKIEDLSRKNFRRKSKDHLSKL